MDRIFCKYIFLSLLTKYVLFFMHPDELFPITYVLIHLWWCRNKLTGQPLSELAGSFLFCSDFPENGWLQPSGILGFRFPVPQQQRLHRFPRGYAFIQHLMGGMHNGHLHPLTLRQ